MESKINLNLGNEILNGTEVSTNVKQQIIVVPKDRAKLILKEFEDQLNRKVDWISPIALVITILAVLVTADFRDDILGQKKEFWLSLFTICFFLSGCWCIRNIIVAARQKNKSVDTVIEELRNEQECTLYEEIDNLSRFNKWIIKKLLKKRRK